MDNKLVCTQIGTRKLIKNEQRPHWSQLQLALIMLPFCSMARKLDADS